LRGWPKKSSPDSLGKKSRVVSEYAFTVCGKTPGVGVLKGHGFPVAAEKLFGFRSFERARLQPCRKPLKTMCGPADAAPVQGCQSLISALSATSEGIP